MGAAPFARGLGAGGATHYPAPEALHIPGTKADSYYGLPQGGIASFRPVHPAYRSSGPGSHRLWTPPELVDPAAAADQTTPTPPLDAAMSPEKPLSHNKIGSHDMALDTYINDLLTIEGATGAAVVDIDSGMALATGGSPDFDLELAAAGNSNVVRAKLRTMKDLGLNGSIEDILITLDDQYHLIKIIRERGASDLFVYLVLNRAVANLALARHRLRAVSADIRV